MNWYKKAMQGEWWIIDGQAIFADSDTGDMGHEAYVIEGMKQEIAESFNVHFDEFSDWDEIKQQIIGNYFDELDETEQTQMLKKWSLNDKEELIEKVPYNSDIFDTIGLEAGNTKEQLDVADGAVDARDYGMKNLGWKRVESNNIQTWTLTSSDLHSISNGIDDILGESGEFDESSNQTFNIEVMATRKVYWNVPLKTIESLKPKEVAEFGGIATPYTYAKTNTWYKKAQEQTPETWAGKILYHGTSKLDAENIKTYGIDNSKSSKGYFGRGFYMAQDKELAQSNYADFSDEEGTVLALRIDPNTNILDLRNPDHWEIYQQISQNGRLISQDNFDKIMTQNNIDGLYDNSFGGVVVYNPEKLTLIEE